MSNITTVVNGQTVVVPPRAYCALPSPTGGPCIAWTVDPTTYTWSSNLAFSADVVSIPQSAVYAGEQFVIGVFATSPDDGNGNPPPASHYDIVATTTGTVTTMQAGVAIPGIASPGLYKSYRFDIANAAAVIVLATLDMGASRRQGRAAALGARAYTSRAVAHLTVCAVFRHCFLFLLL